MNVHNLVESSRNEFKSPLLYDDGNDKGEKLLMCSKCEWNLNSNDPDLEVTRSEYEAGCDTIPQGCNGLELENTVDYTQKQTENGIPKSMSTLHNTVNTVALEETVDYVNKQLSPLHSSFPTKAHICSPHESTTNPSPCKCMHNIQNVEQSMPYINQSTDTYYSKTEPLRPSQFTIKQTDEACGNVVSEQVEMGAPFTKLEDMEAPTLNLFSLSWDMSDEMCMRKNSLVSSGSEKPMSASLLESSVLPNTSIEVFSESLKWTNNISGCCQSGEQSTKDLNYFEVPPHNRESKESVLINTGPELANQPSDMDVITCSAPKEGDVKGLQPPDNVALAMKMRDDLNQNNMCPLPVTGEEAIIPVFHIEEGDVETKNVNGVLVEEPCALKSSTRTVSMSSESKNVLNNLSGHTCEDTFLIESPISHTEAKAYTSTPLPESKNMTFTVPVLDDIGQIEKAKSPDSIKDINMGCNIETLRADPGNGTTKQINKKLATVTSATKAKKNEVVNFPKPNFKNVKAKVLTRPVLLTKDCPSSASKPSPRSPQSNASSPVASPRAPASAIKTLRKKPVLDQDLKAVAAIAKYQKQPINKQLFPSQPTHAPTHTKYAQGKVPRTAVLKQTPDEVERVSSSNSTRSSASAAALTCTASSKVTENKSDKAKVTSKPAAVNGVHMGPDKIKQNGLVDAPYEKSKSQKEDCTSGNILANVPTFSAKLTTPSKNLHKELLSCLRNATSQPVSTAKARLHSSEQRRGSLTKNVVTVRVSSPPRLTQQPSLAGGVTSPKGKPNILKGTTQIWPRSLPRTRIPCKGAALQRTPSVSSVCSTHSDQSTLSTRSTAASSEKTDEVPLKSRRHNGGTTKVSFTRTRSQSLKVSQTVLGTKKSPTVAQGAPKTSISPALVAKRVETKVVNGVDKGKPKPSARATDTHTPTTPKNNQSAELSLYKTLCLEKQGVILGLKDQLIEGNRNFEALALVVQYVISRRDEAIKKRKDLSEELVKLRSELVSSTSTFEKLDKEKNDLRSTYEELLLKVKADHLADISNLESKLMEYYLGECEKYKDTFIDEVEKYRAELQEKINGMNDKNEAYRLAVENSYAESLGAVKLEYENTLSELRANQEKENKTLEESANQKQAELQRKIAELTQENDSLKEKLRAEEEQRKIARDKVFQKNPQVLYLEQELESLKAVLEIKNEKLHQQDKKLMQIEKLVDTNATLVERLTRCQQENEDLKARMANHIALSRQLSTEQEVLQRSLEKESKVNKRLSMENEELVWKLNNGDLCSPKKLLPPSPFHPSLSSGSFTSPPMSPR